MVFLASMAFLGWANIITMLRRLKTEGRATWPVHIHMLALFGFMGAFIFGILLPGTNIPQRMDQPNWAVWGFFVMGSLSAVAFGERLVRAARNQAPTKGVGFGMSVWAMLAGLYSAGTVLDHWWFFADARAGIASAAAFNVDEVACDRPLLVRIGDHDALYRCPKLAVYGPIFGQPFVPWPDYRQGRSEALKAAIEDMMRNAVKVDGTADQ